MFRLWALFIISFSLHGSVEVGLERLFSQEFNSLLVGKNIALLTNQTAITKDFKHSISLFKENEKALQYNLKALFAPEHGLDGSIHSEKTVQDQIDPDGIAIYSLFNVRRRATDEMLKGIDLIVYDIQDIGSRSYTYTTALFYLMEEAATRKIPLLVLDRPNPINGLTVDGPMLKEPFRSYIGYINVPYCHGMTVGELATLFNDLYNIKADLTVIPLKGWRREMSFKDTGLPWIPTSPNIPQSTTALYYPITGIIGELPLVNIGVGYTLPFQLIGAPWIEKEKLSNALNAQNLSGVHFYPYCYQPFHGKFSGTSCQGVLISVTDPKTFKPVTTGYVIMGVLKSLYPKEFAEGLKKGIDRKEMFCKANGNQEVHDWLLSEPYVIWKLKALDKQEREAFLTTRKKYLNPLYQ